MCFIMCILQYAAKILLFFYSRKRFHKKNKHSTNILHWYYAIISRHTHRYSLMVCLQDHRRC